MFSIFTKQENDFEIIVLNDDATQTSVEIIPASGGILHAFNVRAGIDQLNVVEQYRSKKEFDNSAEVKGFKSCKLSPFVCRLKDGKYHFGEKDYSIEKYYLGKHALHGLIYDAAFDVIQLKASATSASAELLFSYKGTDKGFPFKYDCRVIYELKAGNALHIKTIVKNHESHAIPMQDGWHPYFTFGSAVDELSLFFRSKEMFEFDEELIPTKTMIPYDTFHALKSIADTKFDNGFLVETNADEPVLILRSDEKKLQLEITTDKSYPVLQIYIPEHRQSIAIENLSGPPDAFNNQLGLTVLQGNAEAIFNTTYTIKSVD